MDFQFYLFGAPLPGSFALYPFHAADMDFFRAYASENSEKVKRVIRCSETQITYSYLRYDLLPANPVKSGAFFGMAVAFKGTYCKDVEGLYELFEAVFTGAILKNGRLLQETPSGQLKFMVDTLKETVDEIKTIEQIVRKNIENHFQSDISPMDADFKKHIREMVSANAEMGIVLEEEVVPAEVKKKPAAPVLRESTKEKQMYATKRCVKQPAKEKGKVQNKHKNKKTRAVQKTNTQDKNGATNELENKRKKILNIGEIVCWSCILLFLTYRLISLFI
jgi:hypothetical protein